MLDKWIFLRIICSENRRKECMQMRSYDREVYEMEMRLMKEISGMKFSMKKLRKIIELEALLSCQTNWSVSGAPWPQIFRGKGTLRPPRRFIYIKKFAYANTLQIYKTRVCKYASDIKATFLYIPHFLISSLYFCCRNRKAKALRFLHLFWIVYETAPSTSRYRFVKTN